MGKTYWIKHHYPDAILLDMLKSEVFAEYASKPQLLRERFQDTSKLIVIDEVQMVPDLLNEVHWLIENKNISFLLTGVKCTKITPQTCKFTRGSSLALYYDALML